MPETPSLIEKNKAPESKDSIITEAKKKIQFLLAEMGFKKWEKPETPGKPENPPEVPGRPSAPTGLKIEKSKKPTTPPETPGKPIKPERPEIPGKPENPPETPGIPKQVIDSVSNANVIPDTGAGGFDANNIAPPTDSGTPINPNPNW